MPSLLVVGQKGSALLVGGGRTAGPGVLLARPGRVSDDERRDEQDGHDGEGEDPLECDNLALKLRDTESGGEHTERETHSVVLVDGDEESAVDKDGPDEDVAEDARNK